MKVLEGLIDTDGSVRANGHEIRICQGPANYRIIDDVHTLAMSLGFKRAEMALPLSAERSSGYVVGGISPVGQRKALPTVIDESAQLFDTIFVSGGKRGFDIEISPAGLLRATHAIFADLCRS